MIKYHGTPIGGPEYDAARFLKRRHGLVSYKYQQQIAIVADICQSFVLDCGAFTFWKQGGEMDYQGYLEFVEHWHRHPRFDWALIPDVIDGSEKENDEYLSIWPASFKGVPVWHMHESIERLKRLCEEYEYVALGSSGAWPDPGKGSWWIRMEEIMDAICDEYGRPPCRLHGLRMMDPAIFERLPLSSADSTNVGRSNSKLERFGLYRAPSTWVRTTQIADRIEERNSAAVWVRKNQLKIF
jgi:hypothetical protein